MNLLGISRCTESTIRLTFRIINDLPIGSDSKLGRNSCSVGHRQDILSRVPDRIDGLQSLLDRFSPDSLSILVVILEQFLLLLLQLSEFAVVLVVEVKI